MMHCFLTKEQRESYLREVYYSSFNDRRCSIAVAKNDDTRNLGKLLQKLYNLVKSEEELSSEADKTLKGIIKIRMKGKANFYEAKLYTDYKRYLLIRAQRDETMRKSREQQCFQFFLEDMSVGPTSLHGDDWYWGTRQQLRCGEIIGDTLGGIDGVFGALLFPRGNCFIYLYKQTIREDSFIHL